MEEEREAEECRAYRDRGQVPGELEDKFKEEKKAALKERNEQHVVAGEPKEPDSPSPMERDSESILDQEEKEE